MFMNDITMDNLSADHTNIKKTNLHFGSSNTSFQQSANKVCLRERSLTDALSWAHYQNENDHVYYKFISYRRISNTSY